MKARLALSFLLLAILALVASALWPPALPLDRWCAEAGVTPERVTVTVRGKPLTLRYVRKGHGDTVLLLHGLGSSIATFRKIMPDLARDHDVVALDLPGFGGSEIPFTIDLPYLPEAALAFADALHLPQATWLGNSLGGGVAIWVAAEHKERVSHLVLVDSVGVDLSRAAWPRTLRLSVELGPFIDWLPIKRPLLARALREVFYDPAFVTREEVDDHLAPLERPGASAAARAIVTSSPPQADRMRAAIGRISVPTLVIWGREDRWLPVAHAAAFEGLIPGASVRVLDRCGHVPQEECPDATLGALRAFLGGKS